ncbi:hypothetical protein EVB94_374 [Rhizobium phage RHph_TM40]|uniref:Uncharacterized protein n=2 Tax=Cuauhnahuacvirus TaxID=3044696 RepID=A0A7S5R874_9CAUD|nr:hypothetical protein PQC16_gp286 [Rhizobium phage RHph_TM30]YP_010671503.1 hypothetical protein PQC17_gp287 [Rhizobium phage RHph_Y65]QIG71825.1 hypothetical protein EVB94_374 [Rhizobium phage RHph_TM40]QIG72186.1 hypothetical protein EVB95_373 [Rhizobium phage RHph_TM2_3B]QIG72549.1 hypothetical protein EVB96_373 [Rhizobium phage RHph_TM3_3_6]QIG71462.1 hypothetical protein EVB93_375 [Rhizobium phage RHph_TM30]QIG72912.1 hypothetical protein EVB97_374 [Rhizobium phage RHph_Y65]
MKLTEIIDYMLLETGQFIVGDISLINFDMNRFWLIVKRSLKYYEKHKPITKKLYRYIPSTPYVFPPDEKPSWISRVYPTGIPANFGIFNIGANLELIPVVFQYNEDEGKLHVANASEVEITAHFKYKFTIEFDTVDDKKIVDVDIPDLDESEYKLLTHIKGNFLLSLGRSRRAFTSQDFPIQMDSNELISEGQQIVSEIEQSISDTNSWYYAIGG